MRCYSSRQEADVSIQSHIRLGMFYEHKYYQGSTLTVYNNDYNSTACLGGVPNLKDVGFNDKISSLWNDCAKVELYFDAYYGPPSEPFGNGPSNVSPGMNDETSSIWFYY